MNYLYYFAGFVTGALLAVFSVKHFYKADARTGAKHGAKAAEERLNDKEMDEDAIKKREQEKKLQKQFDNMMAYTGKRQV